MHRGGVAAARKKQSSVIKILLPYPVVKRACIFSFVNIGEKISELEAELAEIFEKIKERMG